MSWSGPSGGAPSDDEKQQVYDGFAETISLRLMIIVAARMRDEAVRDWQRAYNLSGKGSTFTRATVIASDIYDKAAPVPDVTPTPDRNKFLHEVIEVVRTSAEAHSITLQ